MNLPLTWHLTNDDWEVELQRAAERGAAVERANNAYDRETAVYWIGGENRADQSEDLEVLRVAE